MFYKGNIILIIIFKKQKMACAQNCDLSFIQCFNQCEPIVGSDCTRDCTAELESCKVISVVRPKVECSIELFKDMNSGSLSQL